MYNINTALMAKELTENPERPTKEPANIKEYISAALTREGGKPAKKVYPQTSTVASIAPSSRK